MKTWIEIDGRGECPVDTQIVIEIKRRDGSINTGKAGGLAAAWTATRENQTTIFAWIVSSGFRMDCERRIAKWEAA